MPSCREHHCFLIEDATRRYRPQPRHRHADRSPEPGRSSPAQDQV